MSEFWTWMQRRNSVRADFVLSIADQALVSGGAVFATAILAYYLSPIEFGRFTIAWAMAALFEAGLLKPLLDDPLASVAVKVRGNIRQLRSSFLLWSTLLAGAICCLAITLSIIWVFLGMESAPLYAATGLVVLVYRLQNAMRRIFYFDRRLRLVLSAAITYFVVLSASLATMIVSHQISAATAMLCVALSSIAAFSFALVRRRDFMRPNMAMFWWSFRTLTSAGRWIAAAGLAFWAGSVGIIPVAGILLGSAASGSLRLLFLLFAPLSQLNIALLSMMIPRAAISLRVQAFGGIRQMSIEKALVLGSVSAAYGLCIVLGAAWLNPAEVLPGAYQIAMPEIVLMAAAMTFEGIWAGLALPLYATAQTKRFLASRLVSVPFLLVVFPLATWIWGIPGTVAAIVGSSAMSALLLAGRMTSNRFDLNLTKGAQLVRPKTL